MSAATSDIAQSDVDRYLEFAVSCQNDPVRWIEHAYPWGVSGTALAQAEPHKWHIETATLIRDELEAIRSGEKPIMPIQISVASGHGIGKSALTAMLNDWNMSTMRNARGVTTANTLDQLKDKTWAEMSKWHNLSISRPFFTWTATQLFSSESGDRKSWATQAAPWNEQNTEAFQGLHNRDRRILLQFDEASAIPRIIWEVIDGAKTDENTQIIHLAWGNPTRNSGFFYETFGKRSSYWHSRQIDSRDVPGTNKELMQQWAEEHGEDSDFFRIRVRGLFPRASAEQFISTPDVEKAMARDGVSLADDPLICGIDFARSGNCSTVMYWRRGKDGQLHQPDIYKGETDSMVLVSKLAHRLKELQPDIIYGDADGLGGPIVDRLLELGFNIVGVHSASSSEFPERNLNKRADMWLKGKNWIQDGGALWNDERFKSELTVLEVIANASSKLQMESKISLLKRGEASPDIADAFMLTHAYETTELISIEHMSSMNNERVNDDFNQWNEEDGMNESAGSHTQAKRDWRSRMRHLNGSDRKEKF